MNKLSQACELSLNDWLATFPDEIPEAECSAKHEKWKKNLFNKMRDDRYHVLTTKAVRIIFVAAILCSLLMTAFVIPSSREFILDKFDTHSTFKITKNNDNFVTREITIDYIPEGFELDRTIYLYKQIIYRYQNADNKFFTIIKQSSSMEVNFDTESFVSEEIVDNNATYIYCQGNENVNNLIWTKNDYVYRVSGTLTKEELLKIAKNVN